MAGGEARPGPSTVPSLGRLWMMGGSPESGGVASAPGVCKVETDQAVGWGWGAGGPSHLASTLPLLPETCRPWGASPGAQVPVTSKIPGPLCPLCPGAAQHLEPSPVGGLWARDATGRILGWGALGGGWDSRLATRLGGQRQGQGRC